MDRFEIGIIASQVSRVTRTSMKTQIAIHCAHGANIPACQKINNR